MRDQETGAEADLITLTVGAPMSRRHLLTRLWLRRHEFLIVRAAIVLLLLVHAALLLR
ncbi:hypothetical protein [Pelagovum pacificum]|uniref:hypothetical protein n=1 Tax=Pelagovum pacificum TaxID=2588711 RepID=UPI0018CD9E02|nr:hypothetical protein [Pelagovum pacificum]